MNFFISEIIILGTIVCLTSRIIKKILRGLQGIAITTTIARGIYAAYKSWKDNGSSSNSNDSCNEDTDKDKVENQENKPKPVPTALKLNKK